MPLISVVIIKYGNAPLQFCLDPLVGSRNLELEIVVIDNGPFAINTMAPLQSQNNIKYVKMNGNAGYAGACNEGAKVTRGEFILFLNQDAQITEEHLHHLVSKLLEDPAIAVIQPLINPLLEEDASHVNIGGTIAPCGVPLSPHSKVSEDGLLKVFYACGAIFLVRRKVFDEIGGFDSDYFMYYEDVDFCWRARLNGYKVFCDLCSRGYHPTHETHPILTSYYSERNKIVTLLKNYSLNSISKYLPMAFFASFGKAASNLRDNPHNAMFIARAWLFCLVNFKIILKKRSIVQKSRKISDDELLKGMIKLNPVEIRAL